MLGLMLLTFIHPLDRKPPSPNPGPQVPRFFTVRPLKHDGFLSVSVWELEAEMGTVFLLLV